MIALIRGEIKYDPDIHPAVGFFAIIELCTVEGHHENKIMFPDVSIEYCS